MTELRKSAITSGKVSRSAAGVDPVRFQVRRDGVQAVSPLPKGRFYRDLAIWGERVLRSASEHLESVPMIEGDVTIRIDLEPGSRGLQRGDEAWLEWKLWNVLGASQGLEEPEKPDAIIDVAWLPTGKNLTASEQLWQEGTVTGRAKDGADGAFPKKPKRERSPRLQKAERAHNDLDQVARELTAADVEEFADGLREAQLNPPTDKARFVRDKHRFMVEFGLWILIDRKPLGRLRFSNGSIQIVITGSKGTRPFSSTPISIAHFPERAAWFEPTP